MNESAIGGFNLLRFENVINSALDYLQQKGVEIDKTIVSKRIKYDEKGRLCFVFKQILYI